MSITRNEAADRIALFASEGRLIQSQWHSERDGRELACLLGAIGPDVNAPDDCPAEVMPAWLAHLLPTLFDGVRPERAMEYGTRFADALRTGRTGDDVKRAFLVGAVEQALASATPAAPVPDYWPAVEGACRDTIAALRANDAAALTAAAWAAAWAAERAAAAAGAAANERLFDTLLAAMTA